MLLKRFKVIFCRRQDRFPICSTKLEPQHCPFYSLNYIYLVLQVIQ